MRTVLSIFALAFPILVIPHDCPEWVEVEMPRYSMDENSEYFKDETGNALPETEREAPLNSIREKIDALLSIGIQNYPAIGAQNCTV